MATQIAALHASGYLHALGNFEVQFRHYNKEKAIVKYIFKLNKLFIIDSVSYSFDTAFSRQILKQVRRKSQFLFIGQPFNVRNIENEMDRINTIFHNNGYAQFSKNDIGVEIDTVEPNKKSLHLLFFRVTKKPNSKKFNYLTIQFNNNRLQDSTHFIPYTIASIHLNTNIQQENKPIVSIRGIYLNNNDTMYKNKFLINQLTFSVLKLYNQGVIHNTKANFNNVGNWSSVSVRQHYNPDSTIDIYYDMVPSKRYGVGASLELARSTSELQLFNSSFGVYGSANFFVRNVFRRGIQYKITGSYGIDLAAQSGKMDIIQTNQVSLTNTLRFPHFLIPNRDYFTNIKETYNSLLLEGTYIERPSYYRVFNIRLNFSYNWIWKGFQFQFIPLNIESYNFTSYPKFQDLINQNINYMNLYNNGTILSMQASLLKKWNMPLFYHFLLIRAEESNLWGMLGQAITKINNLSRFVQLQTEWIGHLQSSRTTNWAFRMVLGNNFLTPGYETPFFRKLYEGGPNSMRAWLVRGLGPGSVVFPPEQQIIDRVGDIKMEANIEFRFNIIKIKRFKIESALFVDAGNIWTKQPIFSSPEGQKSVFHFNTFIPQIAMDAGTGIRLNFNDYFILRLDWAYKIKDPVSGWISRFRVIDDGTLQFGIGYPF
ncbi:MAG: BamA/TamA family outer membrane protein [Chitinophagaceae bacterium]